MFISMIGLKYTEENMMIC